MRDRASCNLQIKYQRLSGPVSELWPYQMSPFGHTSAWSPLLLYVDTYFLTWLQHLQSFFFLLWFLLNMFYTVLFSPLGVIRRLENWHQSYPLLPFRRQFQNYTLLKSFPMNSRILMLKTLVLFHRGFISLLSTRTP